MSSDYVEEVAGLAFTVVSLSFFLSSLEHRRDINLLLGLSSFEQPLNLPNLGKKLISDACRTIESVGLSSAGISRFYCIIIIYTINSNCVSAWSQFVAKGTEHPNHWYFIFIYHIFIFPVTYYFQTFKTRVHNHLRPSPFFLIYLSLLLFGNLGIFRDS